MKKTLLVVVGPTAIGKTHCAIELAKHYQTEIISADSRQFYKELNIGVARPGEEQLLAVKHHFIACRSVKDEYNAGEYEKDALECLSQVFAKHDVAVLVGGSGLYVRAVCEGFDELPYGNEEVKNQLDAELEEKGLPYLQEELKKADPAYYEVADIQNPRRVVRALEVFRVSGKPFSSYRTASAKRRDFQIVKIGLNTDRKKLYDRINQRVDVMMEAGLLDEVKSLVPLKSHKALHTVGYDELFDHLEGKTDLETAVNLIKQHTRNFAKRQLTWFRREEDIQWFEPGDEQKILEFIKSTA